MADRVCFRLKSNQQLCDVCQALEFLPSESRVVSLDDSYPLLPRMTERAESCRLCSILLQEFRAKSRLRPSFSMVDGRYDVCLELVITAKQRSTFGFRPKLFGSIDVRCLDSASGQSMPIPDHAQPKLPFESAPGQRFSLTGSASAASNANPMKQARRFLNRCGSKHKCTEGVHATEWRPTRLLKIHSTDTVSLDIDENNYVEYAALSYRWGPPPFPHNTTKNNFDERLDGFSAASLPQTIKDAISVANDLGVKHIWIDSLCIIQDDEADWKREASQMNMVYRGAWIVIAALESESVTESFLNRSRGSHLDLEIEVITKVSTRTETLCFKFDPFHDFEYPETTLGRLIASSTWATRGWMLQEQLLSNRILYFTLSMVIFECPQCIYYGNDRHRIDKSSRNRTSARWPRNFLSIGRDFDIGFSTLHPYEQWYEILKTYTARSLTYGKDKLPAIEGLARQIAVGISKIYLKDNYVWGLWKEDLRRGLLWCTSGKQGLRLGKEDAPSWSWVAINAAVYYGDWMFDKNVEYISTISDLLGDYSDSEGAASTAHYVLALRGHTVTLRDRNWKAIGPGIFEAERGTSMYLDEADHIPDVDFLLFPLLVSTSKVDGRLAQALVLERQEEFYNDSPLYRRIGTAYFAADLCSQGAAGPVHVV